jgi:hypothetical protein
MKNERMKNEGEMERRGDGVKGRWCERERFRLMMKGKRSRETKK